MFHRDQLVCCLLPPPRRNGHTSPPRRLIPPTYLEINAIQLLPSHRRERRNSSKGRMMMMSVFIHRKIVDRCIKLTLNSLIIKVKQFINMIFLVGSGRRENFAIWDCRRRRSWGEHVTHCLPMKKISCQLIIIWSISLCMGNGSGRVLSISGRGAIPVLWIGVTEPVMVRLLTNSCLTLTDGSGWKILVFILKNCERIK